MSKKISALFLMVVLLFSVAAECFADTEAQFKLAKEYANQRKDYKKAESICKEIIAANPGTNDALKAQRMIIGWLSMAGDDAGAQAAFDKMLKDYAGNPNLAGQIYWLARVYRMESEFDKAKDLYQQVIQNYPNSPFVSRSQINIRNMEIWSLVDAGQFSQAKTVLDQVVKDFSGDPDLPEAIFWTAKRFRQADQFSDASNLYTQIIQKYPSSPFAKRAVIELQNCELRQICGTGDLNNVMSQIDKVINTCPKDSNVASMISKIAGYYCDFKRFELWKQGKQQESMDRVHFGAAIFEKVTTDLPPSADYTPEALAQAAKNYKMCKDYGKAIKCYGKIVTDWPNYTFACEAAYEMVASYNQWKQTGGISEDAALAGEKGAYETILKNWPDCSYAKDASIKLGWLNFNKGRWTDAIRYWQSYLDKYPNEENLPDLSNMLYALGRAYEETTQRDKAISTYEKLLKMLSADDPREVQVQTRLEGLKMNL